MNNKYGYFKYSDFAVGAKEDAQYSINVDLQQGSALTQLRVGVKPYDFASLEKDAYITANPKPLYKSGDLGLLTKNVSDENGEFKPPIVLFAKFPLAVSMTGITISSRNIIKQIKIEAFQVTDVSKLVASQTFTATSKEMFYPISIEKANLITFTVSKIDKSNHFFGIFNIEYGKIRTFEEDTRIKTSISNNFSLLGDTLEYDTLDLTIIEPEKSAYFFQKKQPLDYMIGNVPQQRFYIDKGEEDETQTIRILAYDEIANLEGEFLGGIYESKSASQIVDEILKDTGIPYDTSNMSVVGLSGYIPITSRRKALQTVLLASHTRCYKGEKLVFKPIEEELQPLKLDETNIIKAPKIEKKQELKFVSLTAHRYSKQKEQKEIYHWYISTTEDTMIKFSEPMHDLQAFEVIGTDEFDNDIVSDTPTNKVAFVKSEVNYCVVRNQSSNKIVIKGSTYVDSTIEYRKENPLLSAGSNGIEVKLDLTIGGGNPICNELYKLYMRKNKITFRTIERLKIGCLYDILGEKLNIKSIKHELNGVYEVEAM